jgi:hypothetical protein
MPDMDDLKRMAEEHDDQIDAGMEKAGDAAGAKFGHEEQIDQAVEKGQGLIGGDDQNDQSQNG